MLTVLSGLISLSIGVLASPVPVNIQIQKKNTGNDDSYYSKSVHPHLILDFGKTSGLTFPDGIYKVTEVGEGSISNRESGSDGFVPISIGARLGCWV